MAKEISKVTEPMRKTSVWTIIFFIVGVFSYISGFFWLTNGVWHDVLLKIGDVLVIGVVLGFITNASEFLGIFKKELENIVYGKEFLANQKDVSGIWETVSKEMFKNKFPGIHHDFLKALKSYFPNNEVSYYEDYEMHSRMEWFDKSRSLVKVVDEVSFKLIAESDGKFVYPLKHWNKVAENGFFKSELTEFSVNGEVRNLTSRVSVDDEMRCEEWKVEMEGEKVYNVHYITTKILNLNEDNVKGFRAKYIVKDFRLTFDCPKDISAQFVSRGTIDKFLDTTKMQTENHIEKRYNGIILPKQGFVISLQQKKQ